jgi:hypothetical protein
MRPKSLDNFQKVCYNKGGKKKKKKQTLQLAKGTNSVRPAARRIRYGLQLA